MKYLKIGQTIMFRQHPIQHLRLVTEHQLVKVENHQSPLKDTKGGILNRIFTLNNSS